MGRPKKENNVIQVNDIKLNFISKKEDGYGNEVCYFKCMEKNKLKNIIALKNADLKLPLFISDNGSVILKVKNKFIKHSVSSDDDGLRKLTYLCDLHFERFSFESENALINGFYLKMPKIEVSEVQSV